MYIIFIIKTYNQYNFFGLFKIQKQNEIKIFNLLKINFKTPSIIQ